MKNSQREIGDVYETKELVNGKLIAVERKVIEKYEDENGNIHIVAEKV